METINRDTQSPPFRLFRKFEIVRDELTQQVLPSPLSRSSLVNSTLINTATTMKIHKVPRIDLLQCAISRVLRLQATFLAFWGGACHEGLEWLQASLHRRHGACSLDGQVVEVLQPLQSCAVTVRGVRGPRKLLSCCYVADSLDILC